MSFNLFPNSFKCLLWIQSINRVWTVYVTMVWKTTNLMSASWLLWLKHALFACQPVNIIHKIKKNNETGNTTYILFMNARYLWQIPTYTCCRSMSQCNTTTSVWFYYAWPTNHKLWCRTMHYMTAPGAWITHSMGLVSMYLLYMYGSTWKH